MFKMCKNCWIILVPLLGCILARADYPPSEEILPLLWKDHEVGHTVSVKTENWDYDFKRCTIELPEQMGIKEELEFSPRRSNKLPDNIKKSSMYFSNACSLEIRDVGHEETGKWLMRSYVMRNEPDRNFATNHTVTQEFTIRLVKKVDGVPHHELRITEGNNLYLRLKDPLPDMVSCSARLSNGKTHILWEKYPKSEKENDNHQDSEIKVQYWGSSPEKGDCGMKMIDVKNKTAVGEWHLEAVDKNDILHKAMIKVHVYGSENDSKEENLRPRSLTLGHKETLNLAPKDAVWCRAKPTNGGKEEYCKMSFDPVKKSDAKTWQVSWSNQGSTQIHEADVDIVVREFRQIDTTIDKFEVGDKTNYNLLCRITSKDIQYCVFERQDGKIINLEPGVGTGRYSYYGKGFTKMGLKEEINECGLAIEDSQKEDIGVWKCAMSDANEREGLPGDIAYLKVGSNIEDEQIPHSSDQNKEAFMTGNLTLSCWVRASLDYCFLRHPNGTTLVPSKENSNNDIYDLRSGRCGLQFNNVTSEETGEWRCLMGILGGSEFVTKYVVKIHENAMVSHGKPGAESNSAIISCTAIDNVPLSYCKFVRPDGICMHSGQILDERYKFTGDLMNGICNLTISQLANVDHGTWQCSARLLDNHQEISTEHRLFVPLTTLSQTHTPIILIVISTLTLILIGVATLFYKFKKREALGFPKRYSRDAMPKPEDPIPFYLDADAPIPPSKA